MRLSLCSTDHEMGVMLIRFYIENVLYYIQFICLFIFLIIITTHLRHNDWNGLEIVSIFLH